MSSEWAAQVQPALKQPSPRHVHVQRGTVHSWGLQALLLLVVAAQNRSQLCPQVL